MRISSPLKPPKTDTILREHVLAHTQVLYMYLQYCIWPFCHHFLCKIGTLINSTRISTFSEDSSPTLDRAITNIKDNVRMLNDVAYTRRDSKVG